MDVETTPCEGDGETRRAGYTVERAGTGGEGSQPPERVRGHVSHRVLQGERGEELVHQQSDRHGRGLRLHRLSPVNFFLLKKKKKTYMFIDTPRLPVTFFGSFGAQTIFHS